MRTDIPAPADSSLLNRENFAVTLYTDPNCTPLNLIQGNNSGFTQRDLTPFVKSLSQTDSGGTMTLAWNNELTGGGAGATATPIMGAAVGSGAAGYCNLVGGYTGVVNFLATDNPGAGYTATGLPAVSFTNAPGDTTGSGAAGHAVYNGAGGISLFLDSGGGGYTLPPIVNISGGAGSGASGHSVLLSTGGSIDTATVSAAGTGITQVPLVVVTNASGDVTGHGCTIIAQLNGSGGIGALQVQSAGLAYTLPPVLSFVYVKPATGLTITAGGSGYGSTAQMEFIPASGDTVGSGSYAIGLPNSSGVLSGYSMVSTGYYAYTPTVEIDQSNAPQVNQNVQIMAGSYVCMNCIVGGLSRVTESRGQREMTVDLIRRDQMPNWREVFRTTNPYGIGVDINVFALDLFTNMGLASLEYIMPPTGIQLVHDQTQITGVTAWDGLTLVAQACAADPWVNALGQFKQVSRNLQAVPNWNLTNAQVETYTSGVARAPLTEFHVLWLDPELAEVDQIPQVVGQARLMCGFFSPYAEEQVYFSPDHTQQAKNLYLVIKHTINWGFMKVGQEDMRQIDPYHAKVSVTIDATIPALTLAMFALTQQASHLPDNVTVFGVGASTGVTIPIGRPAQQVLQAATDFVMARMGQGIYEVWGTPYSYINSVNTSAAFDQNAPLYVQKIESFRNDFIPNETHAGALAVNELLYRAKAAATGGLVVADDLRYERGDLVACPNGEKFYITGFRRDLSRGAKPLLTLTGFFF